MHGVQVLQDEGVACGQQVRDHSPTGHVHPGVRSEESEVVELAPGNGVDVCHVLAEDLTCGAEVYAGELLEDRVLSTTTSILNKTYTT